MDLKEYNRGFKAGREATELISPEDTEMWSDDRLNGFYDGCMSHIPGDYNPFTVHAAHQDSRPNAQVIPFPGS